ncbi:hypothetical protein D3C76_249220 [compost metagenome]
MPVRHAGDLDMVDSNEVPTQFGGQVALDDLAVVAVERYLQVSGAHCRLRRKPGMFPPECTSLVHINTLGFPID